MITPMNGVKKGEVINQYSAAELAFANILYNYNQEIDGGSTTALLTELQLDWSQNAWALREELISLSPYLSEEVLRETAEQDALPHAMLLEVCLANPEATRSEGFIDFLETGVPNPMPPYMIDMIVASWNTATARAILESGLARFSSEMAFASNMLLIDLKADTADQQDSIRYWLRRRGTMADEYALAESFMADNQYDSALNRLSHIANKYSLVESGLQASHDDMVLYVNFRKAIFETDRDIMELTSEEVDQLQALAESAEGRSATMAWNILCFGYGRCVDYPPASEEEGSSAKRANPTQNPQDLIRTAYYKLNVFPNPAGEYATFSWELIHLTGTAQLVIIDSYGRELANQLVTTKEGHWLWDTRLIGEGVYFYELKAGNGETLNQGKIVIHK